MALIDFSEHHEVNPVDVVERMAATHDWSFARASEDEVTLVVAGKWTDYQISFTWMSDIEALHLACAFDLKVPQPRRNEVVELVGKVNEQLWIGHFDLWFKDGLVMFRHALLLTGGIAASRAQCESALGTALDTGLGTDESKRIWEQVLAGPLKGQSLKSLIVSHYHPDHVGLAGWLCERFGLEMAMPRPEYLLSLVLEPAPGDYGRDRCRPFSRRRGLVRAIRRRLVGGVLGLLRGLFRFGLGFVGRGFSVRGGLRGSRLHRAQASGRDLADAIGRGADIAAAIAIAGAEALAKPSSERAADEVKQGCCVLCGT